MRYYHCFDVELDLLPQDYQPVWGEMFPILDGDESRIYALGDPIWIGDLIAQISPGDVIVGTADFLDWVRAEYPSPCWELRPSYWSMEICMEMLHPDDDYQS